MKTLIKKLSLITALAATLAGCSKKNDASPGSSSSSWTYNGTSYAAATTVFTNQSLLSIAKANSQETLSVNFKSKPSAGTYAVVNSNVGANQCLLQATALGAYSALLSQGGGTVTVTTDGGKIHASFSNVPMVTVTSQPAGSISGDLTEQ